MVSKRFTYAYGDFVNGKYNSCSNADIIALLNQMTVEEKHDLLSLNFAQIWYRLWLTNTHRGSGFFLAKNKFESTFCADGGVRLRRLIGRATHGQRIWEIPKGRRRNKVELDIHCAIREFSEETNISKRSYHIFPSKTRSYSFVDDGTRYTSIYYLAFARHTIEPSIDFNRSDQIEEISDIRWMSLDQIRLVDQNERLVKFIRPIFRFMRKYAKPKIKK
jgi:8-oxo-dGTP pyrophosphatase MutT (NUDIX family)